ncbi:MAG: hypothetical protein ACI9FU_002227 [Granulosicoccus sp.]|jgi:hypothetical protein
MNNSNQTPELILELNFQDRRSLLYRLMTDDGTVMYYEESDITDHNRPIGMENSVPLYYSLESAWKAISGFVSHAGLTGRSTWHEESNDWLNLKPSFVHRLIRPFIMRSLSDQTRNIEGLKQIEIAGLRTWITRITSESPLKLNTHLSNPTDHVHAKRA